MSGSGATQTGHLNKQVFRQNKAPLSIRNGVLSAGMQLAQKNAPIACGNALIRFHRRTHPGEILRRYDEQKLLSCLGQKNEFFALGPTPPGRNGDAILLVKGMTELPGVKTFR